MKNLSLILLFTILCLCDICVGQTALPESRQSSAEIYVYKLGTADMRKLYDTYQDEWEQFLHTLVASYPDTAATPLLPRGNYLLVQATGNRLKYNLHTVDDLQYDFVNDNRLRLRLTNRTGETVANAQAQVGHRTMRYDPEEEVYTAGKIRRERLLAIEHEGVRHLIAITPEGRFAAVPLGPRIGNFFRRQWYGIPLRFQAKKQPDRSGGSVFVTDKPKYRPGETVRWKAHAGTPKGRPIEKPLELWLNRHERKDTLLATIAPTQPGVYYSEFTLDNALELKLDRTYNLQLKTEDGETILARGTFRHEDYELDGLQFSINSDRQSHRRNTPPTLTLKATDENGIAAMEGRYELTARPTAPYEWETASGYVPDILWEKTIDIQSGASEKITLPDSIFPEGVSFNYRVEGRFVSADNAVKTAFANLHYDGRKSAILIEETATGIRISQSTGSEVDAVPLEITAYTAAGEEISRKEKMSPANYRLPAHASHLTIRSGQAERIYSLSEYKRQPLTVDFYRQNDSIHAQAHNPGEYPFWYQLRKGKHVIAEDYATAFVHHGKQRGAQPYVLSVQYLFGGKIRTIEKSLSIWEKNIHVEVATPTLVYPGQKAQVEVSLTDHKGRPVRNADVTAYAMTSKFNSNLPRIPYWGKTKQDRYKSLDTEETTRNLQNVDGKMTWERWRREMGLDSIAYYRFLHPEPVYLYSDSVKGDMTQIAPYAVIDGELQPVYVIKTYGEPIYYQGTNHLPVYCFRVRGSHPNIELRLSDRIVTLTKVELERGKRHILSVDASQSNPDAGVTVTLLPEKQKGRLSLEERNFLSKYLIGVEDVSKKQSFYGVVGRLPEPEHIQNEERLYYLNAPTTQAYPKFRIQIPSRSVLTGPFPELGNAGLYLKDTLVREFDIEGGYDYKIQNDYIRLKSFAQDRIDQHLIYHGQLRPDFLAQALQRKDVERLHKEHLVELLKQRSPIRTIDWDYKANKFIEPQAKGTLEFDIRSPQDSASLLFILLMNEDQSARWTFAPKGRRLTKLPEGKMTLTFVKDDFSHARQEVEIRKDGTTFFRIDSLATKRDTIYAEWLRHYLWKELFHKSQEVQPEHLTQAIPADEVHGRVFSAFDGSPLPGCTVLAKGRFIGTTTDENGYFALQVPEGCDTLELNYVGFWPELLAITKGDAYNIYLSVKEGSLEEVAVIGYSVIERKLLTSAIQTIKTQDSRALAGKAAEIIAWNAAAAEANAGGQSPLIIVDGKPFAGTLTDLDENSIVSIKRLSPEEGRELYGNRAAGGALIVATGKQLEADTPGNSLRQNFNDAAFWQPHLLTDKEGKVSFETTYPDDITSWDAYFLAFGPQKRTGATEVNIKSFKSLMARLSLPRFAITGDSLNAIGQLNNYQGDTVTVTRKFTTGEVTSEKEMTLASSQVDTIPLIAPVTDSLQATYSLETANGYFDGEKRAIPVYRPGCEESEGIFLLLDRDTTFTLTLDSLAGIITVHAEASPLELFLQEIEEVDLYPYLCNEQMASKLKMLLLKKRIYQWTKQSFKEEKKINQLIKKLTENRNKEGLWGWWNRSTTIPWVSQQVVEALKAAQTEGYEVELPERQIINQLLSYLRQTYTPDSAAMAYYRAGWLSALETLQTLNAYVDYSKYVQAIDSIAPPQRLGERLQWLRVKQAAGLSISLDSVMKHSQRSVLGGLYWHDITKQFRPHPFQNDTQHTLMAYRILRAMGGHEAELNAIRTYFFEVRGHRSWRNTYESSRILETILPDMLGKDASLAKPRLQVNGEAAQVFPFTRTYDSQETIAVSKEGSSPVFFTAYHTSWNPEPEKRNGSFCVNSHFVNEGDTLDVLQAGEEVKLKVEVEVAGEANYAMIEIPIPAGCTYATKNNYLPGCDHAEYWKEKVVLFCTQLTAGKHVFQISLLPRFTGRYHLNPAKAELMYFPTIYGREGMKQVGIK